MTNKTINKLTSIQENIKKLITNNLNKPEIICVSKTFSIDHLKPLIDHGHVHFGENKVQEAEEKWSAIKKENSNLKLHMVGKLQSNKAKKAVQLFDYVHLNYVYISGIPIRSSLNSLPSIARHRHGHGHHF